MVSCAWYVLLFQHHPDQSKRSVHCRHRGYRKNHHDKFTDEGKRVFSEEELNEMARKSSAYWAEVMGLEEQMAKVKNAVTNGIPEDESFELSIPPTMILYYLDL